MRQLLHASLTFAPLGALLAGCGPSTAPQEPDCGTEDVVTEAELIIGLDGPSCNPCPADEDLRIATTLSTECGLVEWQTNSTCLIGPIYATREADGEVFALLGRHCGDAITDWSVMPGEPITRDQPALSQVFDTSPIPIGTYEFEVTFPTLLRLMPASFTVDIESP